MAGRVGADGGPPTVAGTAPAWATRASRTGFPILPTALTVEVEVGQTTSQTFTLSNVGGENAADLDYEISVVAARPAGANGVTLGTSHVTLDLSRPAREAVFSSSHLNRITEAPALPAEQRLVDVVARGGGEIAVVVLTPDNQTGTPDPPTNLVNDLNAFPDVTATMYADPLASITAADLAPYGGQRPAVGGRRC